MRKQFIIATVFLCFLLVIILSGCSKKTDSYYPLKEGRIWEYQVSIKSTSGWGGTQTAKLIVTNFPPRELKGKKVTPQEQKIAANAQSQSGFSFISEDAEGIYEFAVQPPGAADQEIKAKPDYYLKNPIKVGTSWDSEKETSLLKKKVTVALKSSIESIDEVVTVPAGTFKGCVKVKRTGATKKNLATFHPRYRAVANITVENYDWYAPEVGIIKSIIKEKSDHFEVGSGEVTMQLESFKK